MSKNFNIRTAAILLAFMELMGCRKLNFTLVQGINHNDACMRQRYQWEYCMHEIWTKSVKRKTVIACQRILSNSCQLSFWKLWVGESPTSNLLKISMRVILLWYLKRIHSESRKLLHVKEMHRLQTSRQTDRQTDQIPEGFRQISVAGP